MLLAEEDAGQDNSLSMAPAPPRLRILSGTCILWFLEVLPWAPGPAYIAFIQSPLRPACHAVFTRSYTTFRVAPVQSMPLPAVLCSRVTGPSWVPLSVESTFIFDLHPYCLI